MGAFALILGMLGGACAILGIVTATEVLPSLGPAFTWEFWFMLGTILLLASIACALGRGGEID
ncbi:hypothetical protein ACFLV4_01155 [Chloroflexota bacterium]